MKFELHRPNGKPCLYRHSLQEAAPMMANDAEILALTQLQVGQSFKDDDDYTWTRVE